MGIKPECWKNFFCILRSIIVIQASRKFQYLSVLQEVSIPWPSL